MTIKRTEPSAALIPAPGQARIAYVNSASTDIRLRFAVERMRMLKPAPARVRIVGGQR